MRYLPAIEFQARKTTSGTPGNAPAEGFATPGAIFVTMRRDLRFHRRGGVPLSGPDTLPRNDFGKTTKAPSDWMGPSSWWARGDLNPHVLTDTGT